MRALSIAVLMTGLLAAACGSTPAGTGSAPTTAGAGQATPSGATSTPTTAPAGGGQSVSVTLTGGPDAGTYTGTDNPNCSVGIVGPGGWGTQYSVADAADDQLSSLQLVSPAAGAEDDPDSMFSGTKFLMTVTIGPLAETSARTYEVQVVTENSDDEPSGSGSARVVDSGATATIFANGTTADGVAIDAIVNCPLVTRM